MKESEFKWSRIDKKQQQSSSDEKSSHNNLNLFPDLNIKIVNELIGTGGVLSNIHPPYQLIHSLS